MIIIIGQFLLTHLLRGATEHWKELNGENTISTHAPLTRCDLQLMVARLVCSHFYSRTSYEVRPLLLMFSLHRQNFYSRTSYEVRRTCGLPEPEWWIFLLTHLLRGATTPLPCRACYGHHFYSRTSYEVRLLRLYFFCEIHRISTHAPLTRCDYSPVDTYDYPCDFYSRTSYEVRPLHLVDNGSRISIYRKRRTLFRKSTMIQHFSYPNYILFQANLPPFSQHFRFAAATLPAGKTPLALKDNYPL